MKKMNAHIVSIATFFLYMSHIIFDVEMQYQGHDPE